MTLPAPYFDADYATIYHGDALTILREVADAQLDVTITSPPYNQLGARMPNKTSGMFREHDNIARLRQKANYVDDRGEREYQEWQRTLLLELRRVTRGTVWYNHKLRYRDGYAVHPLTWLGFEGLFAEIVWDRGSSFMLNAQRFAESNERIFGFGRPTWWDARWNSLFTVWKIAPQTGKRHGGEHPCPFPIDLPSRLLQASCPPNGLVLDPFLGSGTTLLAARLLGRRGVGIDQEERWCELAARNLERAFELYEVRDR